jgi:hypothetical protein
MVRKYNALIAHLLHVPFPERLPDDLYYEKVAEVKYILKLKSEGVI